MSGLKSRRKGQRAQCEATNILKAHGFEVRNVGKMYVPGHDLEILINGEWKPIEVKRRAKSYKTTYKHLGDNWALMKRDDGEEWLITQPLREWAKR